ncbi:hypothetical protein HDU76_004567 [Blyttiomyces sp. JEL0837]|nr:hypothetical protein HDU76_004567 [Blyttiomyces sp. JEL0837]
MASTPIPAALKSKPPHNNNNTIIPSRTSRGGGLSASTPIKGGLTGPAPLSQRNFYSNGVLEKYAARETKRVTLRQLTVFGRHLTEEKLLRSANYVREELPVRLAHRIQDFQQLPFIVGTNPHIALVYGLYWEAFEKFRSVPEIKTLESNREFCELIERMLNSHLIAIPQLAMGIAETASHMSAERADRFMNEMLRSRIGRRVLAEQHIALSAAFDGRVAQEDGWIGIVNTQCEAEEVVARCAELAGRWFRESYAVPRTEGVTMPHVEPPRVIIDGHKHATFTYIPDHIEYILFELLKNSMRFTFETHAPELHKMVTEAQEEAAEVLDEAVAEMGRDGADSVSPEGLPPAMPGEVRTAAGGLTWNEPGAIPGSSSLPQYQKEYELEDGNGASASTGTGTEAAPLLPEIRITIGASESDITFRVSDAGGGLAKSLEANLWSYAHASKRTFLNFDKMPRLAAKVEEQVPGTLHLGLGLPMSRVYAQYWGGDIYLQSMMGFGCDAYVKIGTGNQLENLTYEEDQLTPRPKQKTLPSRENESGEI